MPDVFVLKGTITWNSFYIKKRSQNQLNRLSFLKESTIYVINDISDDFSDLKIYVWLPVLEHTPWIEKSDSKMNTMYSIFLLIEKNK